MNIYQCAEKAKDIGYDCAKFVALFPSGPKQCYWLDAYFGFLNVEGLDGFVTLQQIDDLYPNLFCSEPFVE